MGRFKNYSIIGFNLKQEIKASGIVYSQFNWIKPHILEIKFPDKENYEKGLNFLSMECPTEVSSMFGLLNKNTIVMQFDRLLDYENTVV